MKIVSPTKLIFLGTPQFAATILTTLANSPFRPVLVITEPDKPVGRGQMLTPPPVKMVALEADIPVAQPATKTELANLLDKIRPDLGVVAAYGRMLTPEMLAIARHGFVNVHASLLPRHRGATPIQAAILAGDRETGVTIMEMDEGLDTGPIISWAPVELNETTTAPELTDLLAEVGATLLIETLPGYLAGSIQVQPQEPSPDPVTSRLTRDSGRLTGSESASGILRRLRAYTPWPGVWLAIDGQRIILLAARQEGHQLVIDQLQLAGKNPVDWVTFCRDRPALAVKITNFLDSL